MEAGKVVKICSKVCMFGYITLLQWSKNSRLDFIDWSCSLDSILTKEPFLSRRTDDFIDIASPILKTTEKLYSNKLEGSGIRLSCFAVWCINEMKKLPF